ncbi:nucleotide sugar dehydrogenase [Dietzia maris]
MSKLVVIGQGYVGLPMALRAVEAGHSVTGLDLNESVIKELNSGVSHIDDVSNENLREALAAGYIATSDPSCISFADVVVVCVPTPLSDDGGPDLRAVEATARTIGRYVEENTTCILESTTYPGTTEEIFAPLANVKGFEIGKNVHFAFSPERIDPGNDTYGVKNTPKVVGGMTPVCTNKAVEFYSTFIDTVVPAKGTREAEMAKLLENTFRHVNIALVNEMVRFSQELGIDLWDAIDAAATKPFGFMPFRPGPGVGGHCIPIDPSYLSHRVKAKLGYAFRMVELAEEINHAAPGYVVDRIVSLLNDRCLAVKATKILLVGVSYKPNITDQRESPAMPLGVRLHDLGANISYFDPLISVWNGVPAAGPLRSVDDLYESALSSDIVVLLQNHRGIDLDQLAEHSNLILDTRGVMTRSDKVALL